MKKVRPLLTSLALALRLICGLSELSSTHMRWRTALAIAACLFGGALCHEMTAATGLVAGLWISALLGWDWLRGRPMAVSSRSELWTIAVGSLAGSGGLVLGTATLATGRSGASTEFSRLLVGNGAPGLAKQGTGTVNLGNGTLDLSLGHAGAVGQQYVIVNNDGADLPFG